MKRNRILLASALVAAAGAAYGAMGPNRGLPQNWSITDTRGYGAVTGIQGNGASTMCVECHTVNPSRYIRDVEVGQDFVVNRTLATHQGSHFVVNNIASGGPWGITNSGGGFGGGFNNAARDGGQYFRSGGWANTPWASGVRSKFGTGAGPVSVYEGDGGATAATADLICESCHNIITNTSTNTDNDLIVGTYQDNVNDGICLGCHSAGATGASEVSGTVAAYGAFHNNDNLAAFGGTGTRKRHHVLTDDRLTDGFYLQGNNSTMWAPSASNRLSAQWCTTPYLKGATVTDLSLAAPGTIIAFRGMCNVAGQGSRLFGALGDGVTDIRVANATTINCSNCHRPHNAMSSAGAFILRMGDLDKADYTGNQGSFGGAAGTQEFGIRRQSDVGSYSTKIYGDYRPLCAGCHFGY